MYKFIGYILSLIKMITMKTKQKSVQPKACIGKDYWFRRRMNTLPFCFFKMVYLVFLSLNAFTFDKQLTLQSSFKMILYSLEFLIKRFTLFLRLWMNILYAHFVHIKPIRSWTWNVTCTVSTHLNLSPQFFSPTIRSSQVLAHDSSVPPVFPTRPMSTSTPSTWMKNIASRSTFLTWTVVFPYRNSCKRKGELR